MHEAPRTPQQRPRAAYPVADVVRVTGGTLTRIHDNWCSYLETGRVEDCQCAPAWRLVAKGGRSR